MYVCEFREQESLRYGITTIIRVLRRKSFLHAWPKVFECIVKVASLYVPSSFALTL